MRRFLAFAVAVLIAGAAAAVEIPLRDGTTISAESYRLTGSYIMITLANGAQLAYDAADVDLEALRAAEAAATAAATAEATGQAEPEEEGSRESLVRGRSLRDAGTIGERESSSPAITDRDVRHVRGSEVRGEGDEGEGDGGSPGVPEGFQQGGGVVLNNLRVSPVGEGTYRIEGEVVNRLPEPVINVRVQLEADTGAGEPWRGEVAVSSLLNPNETGVFQQAFKGEASAGGPPTARASVLWMQQQTRREPDYTKAGGVPHPSNLPLEHGGVAGADVVRQPTPTPVE